ncbi:hypothetical protein B0H19DRAFT_1236587 [Mycena capillaripes]|nr:hypothetical protein B0H19DRAFT_1236587 [Mycena capillaripes]
MAMQLPQELVDAIIDQLANNHKSLKTCSLVCRAWISRSRHHSFASCSLRPNNIHGFRDLLQSPNSTFVPHVRRIDAVRKHGHENDHFFDDGDMRRLVHVRKLPMQLYAFVDGMDTDAFFRTGFITAFLHVTHLDFVGPYKLNADPPLPVPLAEILCFFPALQVLHIYYSTVADGPSTVVPPQGLHSLVLNNDSVRLILAWLCAAGHLPNVNSVTLPLLYAEHTQIVRAALQQLGSALQHLNISLNSDTWTMLDLSLHPNLKTLVIGDFSWDCELESLHSNEIMSLIKTLVAPTLEQLSLELESSTYRLNFHWAAALDAFLSPQRFPRLRNVVFGRSDFVDLDGLESLRAVLPLLEASGVLRTEG